MLPNERPPWAALPVLIALAVSVFIYLFLNDILQWGGEILERRASGGEVTLRQGWAAVERNGQQRVLSRHDRVQEGDRIFTGRHARLVLQMRDDAIVVLGEDTEFFIQEYQYSASKKVGRGILTLAKGFLKVTTGRVARLDGHPFEVVTPVATLGVRGTTFWVFYRPPVQGVGHGLVAMCHDPVCSIRNDAGKVTMLTPERLVYASSRKKMPSQPLVPHLETYLNAILSVYPMPEIPAGAVGDLPQRLTKFFMDNKMVASLEEGRRMAISSLESVMGEVYWQLLHMTARSLVDEKIIDQKRHMYMEQSLQDRFAFGISSTYLQEAMRRAMAQLLIQASSVKDGQIPWRSEWATEDPSWFKKLIQKQNSLSENQEVQAGAGEVQEDVAAVEGVLDGTQETNEEVETEEEWLTEAFGDLVSLSDLLVEDSMSEPPPAVPEPNDITPTATESTTTTTTTSTSTTSATTSTTVVVTATTTTTTTVPVPLVPSDVVEGGEDPNSPLPAEPEPPSPPKDCFDIPPYPTVSQMLSASRTTHRQVYGSLINRKGTGSRVTLTARMLENLIIGKAAQQVTSANTNYIYDNLSWDPVVIPPKYVFQAIVRRFDIYISSEPRVVATMQIGGIDYLWGRMPTGTVRTLANTLFETLGPGIPDALFNTLSPYSAQDLYGNTFTACVRFNIAPTVAVNNIDYNFANTSVRVAHEVNLIPDVTFRMEDLSTEYNGILAELAGAGGLKFFTGGGANPALYIIADAAGNLDDANVLFNSGNAAYPPKVDVYSTSQPIPTSQRLDYYFPLLVTTVAFGDGYVLITP